MSNLDTVVQIIARHEGGWRNNGNPSKVSCWGCGYKPRIGEFHGTHVAKEILATLGLSE